jgi:hypothetical protein
MADAPLIICDLDTHRESPLREDGPPRLSHRTTEPQLRVSPFSRLSEHLSIAGRERVLSRGASVPGVALPDDRAARNRHEHSAGPRPKYVLRCRERRVWSDSIMRRSYPAPHSKGATCLLMMNAKKALSKELKDAGVYVATEGWRFPIRPRSCVPAGNFEGAIKHYRIAAGRTTSIPNGIIL